MKITKEEKCYHRTLHPKATFDDGERIFMILCCDDCGAEICIVGERIEKVV